MRSISLARADSMGMGTAESGRITRRMTRQTDSPRPLPPESRLRDGSARYSGSKSRGLSAAATPGALSSTVSVH